MSRLRLFLSLLWRPCPSGYGRLPWRTSWAGAGSGDQCYCGFHGSTECYGCPDCKWDDDDQDAYPEPEDEEP